MALDREKVTKEIKEVASDFIGIEPEELDVNKKLRLEYGISSVEATELIMEMEDNYNIKIPVSEATEILTTQQAIDYVMENAG